MIDVQDVTKSYGPVEALRGVSFSVEAGQIVGLLGPNGAGKTTILKILTGYLHADAGSVTIDGLDVLTHPREVQAQIGYLPETAPLYPELSVQAYLRLMAELREIPAAEQPTRLSEAIYATELADHLTRPIGQLSKGYRQRVGLAQAILHRPRFLILDEPSIGLDPTQIQAIRRLIRRLAKHSTILFSTHILSEVEARRRRLGRALGHSRRAAGALAGPGGRRAGAARAAGRARRRACRLARGLPRLPRAGACPGSRRRGCAGRPVSRAVRVGT